MNKEPVVINGIKLYYQGVNKMRLPKWKREDVRWMVEQNGYRALAFETEEEAYARRNELKSQRLCAQAGYTINRDGYVVIFVLTKKRGHKSGQNG